MAFVAESIIGQRNYPAFEFIKSVTRNIISITGTPLIDSKLSARIMNGFDLLTLNNSEDDIEYV